MMQRETQGKQCSRSDFRFTGTRYRKWGRWGSEIRLCRSRSKIWLGSYDTPQEAAMAYDAALFCLRGPNSKFNFPDSCSRISSLLSPACTCMSANEIKNFARQYALQRRLRRRANADEADADAEPPSSHNSKHEYEDYAAASFAAAIAFSSELDHQLWDYFDENVVCFQYTQHFNHEHDTKDDDQSEDQYRIESIWSY